MVKMLNNGGRRFALCSHIFDFSEIYVIFTIMEKQPKKIAKPQANNPLHGVKLADILAYLEKVYGWEELGKRINIRCVKNDPSIKSSLRFLRRTEWARKKVETLYLSTIGGR